MATIHADLPDAGRTSHFEIDGQLPTSDEKGALAGEPVPPSDANRYLTENHAAGGFDGFANPTASVGLAAVNGVATTAMRSDAAPALDQGIIPTWTGLHTFAGAAVVSAATAARSVLIVQTTDDNAASNIQEWQDSAGNILARVDHAGKMGLRVDPASLFHMKDGTLTISHGTALVILRFLDDADGHAMDVGFHRADHKLQIYDTDGNEAAYFADKGLFQIGTSAADGENKFKIRNDLTSAVFVEFKTGQNDHFSSITDGNYDFHFFEDVGAGDTKQVRIYGRRLGDGLKVLEIGEGVDAPDTASFDGVSNYAFDGNIGAGTFTPDRRTHAEVSDAVTAAVTYAQRLSHTTSGVAAPLFGVGEEHELEDAGGAMQVASEGVTLWATATAGAESPLFRGTTYPIGVAGPGYWGFWTWRTLADVARTIVPNGAGDVTSGVTIMYWLSESGGGAEGNVVMVANGGAVDLYDDGTDVFTLTVNADGSVTVVRSAGATTANLSLLMCWL